MPTLFNAPGKRACLVRVVLMLSC